jgi:hypothetical protein
MATPKKTTKGLDLAVLQKMAEPISVRVVKIKNNSRQPVHTPGKDGGPQGTGWSRDDILEMEGFVKNQEGGGFYEARVTDSNGTTMEWPFGWDPRVIPEKLSAADQPYAAQAAMPPVQPGQPIPLQPNPVQAGQPLGLGQSWLAQQAQPVYPYAPQQAAQAGQQWPQPQPPWPQPQPFPGAWLGFGGVPGFPGFGGGASTPINKDDTRVRQLEERLAAAERTNITKDYQAQLEAQRQASAQEMAALREELRRLAEAKPSGPDPEVVKAREEAARAREEAERARREAETRDLKQGFQEQINVLRAALEKLATNPAESSELRQIREEQRRTEERHERDRLEQRHREELREIRTEIGKGPDPILTYVTEQSRQQAELSKEAARTQISPLQVMEMIQKQSGGMDGLVKSIIGSFGGAFETYRMMMESLVQMQGGGQSPAQAMLQQGVDRFSDIANQYLAFQRDKSVYEAQAKTAAANAQAKTADAVRAQASAKPQQPPQGYDAGLAQPGPSAEPGAAPAEGASTGNGQSGEAQPAEVIDINDRRPPTEEEMFGPALESVNHLRQGVADGKMRPDQAVGAIIQGVAVCEQQGLQIPAFSLFAEGRFADLMDALLPEAQQQFRDACVHILYQQFEEMQQAMAEEEGEPPEDPPPGS